MGSYKKIGLSHEMGLIDTPLIIIQYLKVLSIISAILFHVTSYINSHWRSRTSDSVWVDRFHLLLWLYKNIL